MTSDERPATSGHGTQLLPLRSGESLAYRLSGDGPAVMLLHGFPGSGAAWDSVTPRLASEHRVIVPDLLGFGRSSKPRLARDLWVDRQAAALEELLAALRIERVALVGHDFGGPVALTLLDRRPDVVTHLVLAATNAFPDTPIPLPPRAVTWPVVGEVASRILFSRLGLRQTLRAAMGRPVIELDPEIYLGDADQVRSIRTIFSSTLRDLPGRYGAIPGILAEVRVPSLVVWGTSDPFFSLAVGTRTAAAIPGSRFVSLDGAGHFIPDERPAEFAALIAELLTTGSSSLAGGADVCS